MNPLLYVNYQAVKSYNKDKMVYIKAGNKVHCCINFCHSHYVDFFFYFTPPEKFLFYVSVANEWLHFFKD